MDDYAITRRLMEALPERTWAEANRRLRCLPALWAACHEPDCLESMLAVGDDPADWRPGPLALRCLAAREPEAADEPEAWLLSHGRDRLSQAYRRLIDPRQPGDDRSDEPIGAEAMIDAVAAALALRQQALSTGDWPTVAAEALADPRRWLGPLACLYGLLGTASTPHAEQMLAALATAGSGDGGPWLAVQVLLANCDGRDLLARLAALGSRLSPAQKLACLAALEKHAIRELAAQAAAHWWDAGAEGDSAIRRFGDSAHGLSLAVRNPQAVALGGALWDHARALARQVEAALLAQASNHPEALTALSAGWQAARRLAGRLSAEIGRAAFSRGDAVTALEAFREALRTSPEDAQLQVALAEAWLALGRTAEALAELGGTHAPLALAYVHAAAGQPVEALALARTTLAAADPTDLDGWTRLAGLFSTLGDLDAAIEAQNHAVALLPTDARSRTFLAGLYRRAGQTQAAIAAATEAVGLAPADLEARRALAAALTDGGNFQSALPHWQAAAAIAPDDSDVALNLARVALAVGEPGMARDAAQVAINTLPEETGEAHTLMGRALAALGEHERALEHFQRAVQIAPASSQAWRAIAHHYRERGEFENAAQALDSACQAIPEVHELLADLAETYTALGYPDAALDCWREAVRLADDRADYLREFGSLLRQADHIEEAVEALGRAAQIAPYDAGARRELGLALEAGGRLEQALAAFEAATELANVSGEAARKAAGQSQPDSMPGPAEAYLDLGRVALQLGRQQQAQMALEERLRREPRDRLAWSLLGDAYAAGGDHERALEAYRQSAALADVHADSELGLKIGRCCLALGQVETGIVALAEAAERDESNLDLHLELGEAYARAGMVIEAAMTYDHAARLRPDDPALYKRLAESAMRLTHGGAAQAAQWRARALTALQRAIALDPSDAGAQVQLGAYLAEAGQRAEARQAFEAALKLAPGSAQVHIAAGRRYAQMGDDERAIQVLQRAVTLQPQSVDALTGLAECFARAGQPEQAHAAYLRAADLEPNCADHWRGAGESMWAAGRPAAAIALWQKALIADPHDTATHARLGMALVRQGKHAEALAALEQAAAELPDQPEPRLEAARAAINLGQFSRAAEHLHRVIQLSPTDGEARYLLGQIALAQNEPQKALAAFRQAARSAPDEGRYLAAAARVLAELGDVQQALADVRSALAISPGDPATLSAAGEVYLRARQPDEAVEAFGQAAALDQSSASAWLAFARALVTSVEWRCPVGEAGSEAAPVREQVMRALQQAAALGADPDAVREWTGRARAVLGDPGEAVSLLESVANARPSPDLYRALGHARLRLDQPTRAREAFESALRRDPTDRLTLLGLGHACEAQGDRAGALAAYMRARAVAPEEAAAHYFYARALLAQGQSEEAVQALEQAVSLRPDAAAWHHLLAGVYDARGDTAAALPHHQRAVSLAADNGEYHHTLAKALARRGDLRAAREAYRQLFALDGEDAMALIEAGDLCLTVGDYECAADYYSRAAALTPTSIGALVGGARAALALEQTSEAEAKVRAALKLRPEDPAALACLAEVYAQRGDLAKALDANAKAIARAKDPLPLSLSRARMLHAAGRAKEALAVLKQAVETTPDSDEAYGLLGDVLADLRNVDGALTAYREAHRLAPRRPGHLLRLGRVCRVAGQLDQSLAYLTQARDLGPQEAEIHREIGQVFEARRQADRALAAYQEAIRLRPTLAENFIRAGIALRNMQNYAESLQMLRRAVDLEPSNLEAHRQLAAVSALGLLHGG